jgi:hypothetical protein
MMIVTLAQAKQHYHRVTKHVLGKEALESLKRSTWYILEDAPHLVSADGKCIVHFIYWNENSIRGKLGFSEEEAEKTYKDVLQHNNNDGMQIYGVWK